jgi:hypothetical protein
MEGPIRDRQVTATARLPPIVCSAGGSDLDRCPPGLAWKRPALSEATADVAATDRTEIGFCVREGLERIAKGDPVTRRNRPKLYEPTIRGALRLDRRWSHEPTPPPVRTVGEKIVRLLQTAARINERARLLAARDASHDEAAGFLAPHRPVLDRR